MSVTEIAKKAGVSTATVSRVLNNHPRVRPETVLQVRKVLEDLQYVRPLIRRGPRLGRRSGWRTGNVAVIALMDPNHTRFRTHVFASALEGIVQSARDLTVNVIVDYAPSAGDITPAIRNRDVDGALIFLPAFTDGATQAVEALRRHMPIVRVMGDVLSATNVDHVGPDNAAVGRFAFQYLESKSCTELLFLSTEPSWDIIRSRALGFTSAARRAGINPIHCIVSRDSAEADLYGSRTIRAESPEALADRIADRVTTAAGRRTGIFISRDTDTVTFLPLLQQRGIEPDRDVTIVSCDNDDVRLSMLRPRPASIDLGAEEVGRQAMIRLSDRIRKPEEPPFHLLVVPHVVVPRVNEKPVEIAVG